MGYRPVRTGKGTPMQPAPWNLPSSYDALELRIKRVMNSLNLMTSNTQRLVWKRFFTGSGILVGFTSM